MITFGRFSPFQDIKKEKEFFLKILIDLIYVIEGFKERRNYNEKEIIEPAKKLLKENINNFTGEGSLSLFLYRFGLSYYTLTQKEKEEILDMDFTYENFKIKVPELMKSFNERLKKEFPKMALFCLGDIYFICYIQICSGKDFRYDNLLFFFVIIIFWMIHHGQ